MEEIASGFEALAQQEEEKVSNPIAEGFEELYRNQQSLFSEQKKALNSTTLLTALATSSDDPQGVQFGNAALESSKRALEAGEEIGIRNQIALKRMERQLASLGRVKQDIAVKADPALFAGVEQAYKNILASDLQNKAKTAIEEEAVDRIRDMAMKNPIQAKVLMDNLEFGNAEQTKHDFNTKIAILRQRQEEAGEVYQNSGWGRWAVNMVLGVISGNYNFQRTGIIGTASLADLFTVGTSQQKESNALMSMPLSDFADFAAKDGPMMESVYDNARSVFDLIADPGAAVDVLDGLLTTGDHAKTMANVWGGLELLSFLPFAKITGATRMLVFNGAVDDAVRNLDNAVHALDTAGPKAMTEATGVTERELTKELSVSAIKGTNDHVPLSVPADAHREAAQKALDEVFNSPDFPKFASAEEQTAFLEGKVKEEVDKIGRVVKDVHIIRKSLPSGQSVTQVEFTLGKKGNGFGFATEAAAKRSGAALGVEFNVVKDEMKGAIDPPKSKVSIDSAVKNEDGMTAYRITVKTPEGDSIPISLSVDKSGVGKLDVGNPLGTLAVGPKEVRAIAAQLADEIPDLKTLEGVRSTGARAKARADGGVDVPEAAAVDVGPLRGKIVRDMSGQFFIKVTKDMPETGWLTTELKPEQQGFIGQMLGRWFSSAARNSDPLLHGKGIQAGSYLNRAGKHIDNEVMGVFRALPGKSKVIIGALGKLSANHEKWLSVEDIHGLVERQWGRRATDVELKAYADLRLFDDMDWELRNTAMYLSKVSQGKESVTFRTRWGEDIEEDVIVDYGLEKIPLDRVYDASRAKHYVHGRNPLDTKTLKTMKNNGYVMLKFPEGFALPEGIVVNNVLIKKTDLLLKPLKREQLAYAEGGHRMYTDRVFVKQGRKGVQADTGTSYLLAPHTFRTASNIAEGKKFVTVMEKARLAVKENRALSAQAIEDDIFLNDPAFGSGDDFLKGVTDGFYDLEHPFEAVFDRELPSMYNKSGEDIARLFNEDELGINGYYRTTGRMYTSSKGEILKNTKGEVGDILDPYDTLSRSLHQVSRQLGMFAYKENALERFSNTYKQWLDVDPTKASPSQILMDAQVIPTAPTVIRNQIEAQRAAILNVLRFETPAERGARQMYQSLAEKVLGEGDNLARKAAHDAVWWWKDNNPVSVLRGLAFDAKLGMFNPGQLLVQASTMLSATALSPKYGMQGMAGLFPMHAYILKRGSENVLETLVKRGTWKTMGFSSPDEFKEYARHAYKHGFMEMNGSHIMVNNYGSAARFGSFEEKQSRFREQARVFFYTAETWNRLVAYRIAWGEAKERGLSSLDPQFNSIILKLADDYSMNMTSESAAFWQKGILSLPTQFWAYNVRMAEAMFGKRFTKAQRARLIGMNAVIAGTAGVPGAQAISEYIKQKNGAAWDIDSVAGMLDRGLIDYLNYQATGQDVLIGERIGTGGWASDVIKSIFGASEYGVQSFADLVGGATYTITKNSGKTLYNLAKYAAAESGDGDVFGEVTADNLLTTLKEVSTFGNLAKAVMIHQYGMLKSNSGTVQAQGLPAGNALYQALSFRPSKADETSYMMTYLKDKSEVIKDYTKQLRNWRQEALVTGDYEKYWKKANVIINLLPPADRREVLRSVNNTQDKSFYDYAERKVQEDKEEVEAFKAAEGNQE